MLVAVHLGVLAQRKRNLQMSFITVTHFAVMALALCHMSMPDSCTAKRCNFWTVHQLFFYGDKVKAEFVIIQGMCSCARAMCVT